MKKISGLLSFVLVFTLVFSTVSTITVSASVGEYFTCDFEDEELTVGTEATDAVLKSLGWNGSAGTIGEIVEDAEHGKCLYYSSTAAAGFDLGKEVSSGTVKISFLYKRTQETNDNFINISTKSGAKDLSTGGTSGTHRGKLAHHGTRIAPFDKTNGLTTTDTVGISKNSWVKLEFVIDMDTRTFTASVDGTPTVNSYTLNIADSEESIKSIFFYNNNVTNFYIDDIVVEDGEASEPIEPTPSGFTCDFNDLEADTEVTDAVLKSIGWNGSAGGAAIGTIANDTEQGNCLYYTGGAAGFDLGEEYSSGKVKISFLYKRTNEVGDNYFNVSANAGAIDLATAGSGGDTRAIIAYHGPQIKPYHKGTGIINDDVVSTSKKWVKLEFVIDMDTKTFTASVDGTSTVNSYTLNLADSVESIKSFVFQNNNTPNFYIDDIVVEEVDSSEPTDPIDPPGPIDPIDPIDPVDPVDPPETSLPSSLGFVCDFETLAADTVVTEEVLKSVGWNGSSKSAEVGTIVEDADHGKCLEYSKGPGIGFDLGGEYSSGIVKITFSYKRTTEVGDNFFNLSTISGAKDYDSAGISGTSRSVLAYHGPQIKPYHKGTGKIESDVLGTPNNKWVKLGFIIDMDTRTVTTYVNEQSTKNAYALNIADTEESIKSFVFHNNNTAKFYVDDFVVKYEPSDSHTVNPIAEIDYDEGHMDVMFDEPLLDSSESMISGNNVTIRRSGSTDTIEVAGVEKVNGKFRIYYSGSFKNGEYTVTFPDGLLSIFGNSVSAMYIDAVVDDSAVYLKNVRYVDMNGDVISGDLITPNVKKIVLTFSQAMEKEALDNITISHGNVSKSEYDSDTDTYILTLGDYLPQKTDVTLSVPYLGTTYKFSTGDGSFEILNLRITSADAEIANTSLAGKTIAVEADILNTAGVSESITVVYLCFNDDELVDMNYKSFSLGASDRYEQIDEEFTVRNDITIDTVKAVLMDGSISDLTVFTDAKVYDN